MAALEDTNLLDKHENVEVVWFTKMGQSDDSVDVKSTLTAL